MQTPQFKIFAGSSTRPLAEKIAASYGVELGTLVINRFSDGEIQPVFGESVRGTDLFLVQSTNPPAENILELLMLMDAAKRASAKSITVVIPYFGYARQDRKDRPRVSIGAKLMADLLQTAGAQRIVTMDLHAGQIQGFFNVPVDNLEASMVFVPHLHRMQVPNLVIAAPDMGGTTRARAYAKLLKADLVLVDKHRERANQISSMQVIGDVKDKNVVIVDDIVDTAGTLCKSADHIMQQGAASVRACISHPILSGPAYERISESALSEVLVTDTLPLRQFHNKVTVLSVAPIFATALRKIFTYESVSSLFPK